MIKFIDINLIESLSHGHGYLKSLYIENNKWYKFLSKLHTICNLHFNICTTKNLYYNLIVKCQIQNNNLYAHSYDLFCHLKSKPKNVYIISYNIKYDIGILNQQNGTVFEFSNGKIHVV